jgi:smad nuclear-interacting protein 1
MPKEESSKHRSRKSRSRSKSPPRRPNSEGETRKKRRNRREESPDEAEYDWGKPAHQPEKKGKSSPRHEDDGEEKPKVDKEKPNFGLSGKLAKEATAVKGIGVKYSEPPDAAKPTKKWILYPFKDDQPLGEKRRLFFCFVFHIASELNFFCCFFSFLETHRPDSFAQKQFIHVWTR